MICKDFQGLKLSQLGFGTMRLPLREDRSIDEEQAAAMTAEAIAKGVNYFDTAWPYHGGKSETVIGEILKQYPRESFYLADKFPGHQIAPSYDVKAVFEHQLEKCGVGYFDFYLLHNVYENSIAVYEDERWGILPYLLEQKKNGRIRHLGFSTHAGVPALEAFLEKHTDEMEFCQIELNYLDWTLQQAKIRALQSQINPHFLNNTLEIINWEARLADNERVCSMIEALSTMLDAAIGRDGRAQIPLAEELQYVDAYLYITKERLGDRLTLRREIDEAMLPVRIPRLMLQPIVENAVEHDLSRRGGELCLRAVPQKDGRLLFEIEHDGEMTLDGWARIQDALQSPAGPAGPQRGAAAHTRPAPPAPQTAQTPGRCGRASTAPAQTTAAPVRTASPRR